MSKARNRPPRLESHAGPQYIVPPPTLEEVLTRSHVAGRAASSSPSELRRAVESAAGDRLHPRPLDDAWASVGEVFGATVADPHIDPSRTIEAACRAVARVSEVASMNGRLALATSRPASLLSLHLALARFGRISGADVADGDDTNPMRVDGRADRRLRWVDGVAVVTDGRSLCSVRGLEAAQEWLFLMPRPTLVIADGPYADAAVDAGIEVIAFAGLEHCSLAVAANWARRCLVVPMWTDRAPSDYRPLLERALATP
jgi:Phosphatase